MTNEPKAPFPWALNDTRDELTIPLTSSVVRLSADQARSVALWLLRLASAMRQPSGTDLQTPATLLPVTALKVIPLSHLPPVQAGCNITFHAPAVGLFAFSATPETCLELVRQLQLPAADLPKLQ